MQNWIFSTYQLQEEDKVPDNRSAQQYCYWDCGQSPVDTELKIKCS